MFKEIRNFSFLNFFFSWSKPITIVFIFFVLMFFKMGIIYAETSFSQEYVQALNILSKGVENVDTLIDLHKYIENQVDLFKSHLSIEQMLQLESLLDRERLEFALKDLKEQTSKTKSSNYLDNLNQLLSELEKKNGKLNSIIIFGFLGCMIVFFLGNTK